MKTKKQYYPISTSQGALVWPQIFSFQQRKVREYDAISFYFITPDADGFSALERAYNRIIEEYDALRLQFVWRGFRIMQYIADYQEIHLPIVKVADQSDFDSFLAKRNQYSVSLFSGHPVQAVLVDIGGSSSAILIRVNHFCADGYSIALLQKKLEKYYIAFANGEEPALPSKRFSITQYFNDDAAYKKSEDLKQDKAFWRNIHLHQRHFTDPLSRRSYNGEVTYRRIEFDGSLYDKIAAFCKEENCSEQFLMMSTWAIMLYRLTGKDNFLIQSLSHGRTKFTLKQTVGCIVNIFPFFYDINPALSFRDYMRKQYQFYLDTMLHSRMPFSLHVLMALKETVKRLDPNDWGIVFSGLNYSNQATSSYQMRVLPHGYMPNQIYCTVSSFPGKSISLFFIFQRHFFSDQDLDHILSSFSNTLQEIMQDPDLVIAHLDCEKKNCMDCFR